MMMSCADETYAGGIWTRKTVRMVCNTADRHIHAYALISCGRCVAVRFVYHLHVTCDD